MSKISIVGVEGSGKTTLMAAFGEKYERPDRYGYGLKAENAQTFDVVKLLTARMRKGQWPNATEAGTVTNLDWTLYRREGASRKDICSVSFLDFAGEVYRKAFGERKAGVNQAQVDALRNHIKESDALVVLINLKDVIDGDLTDVRTREMLWISQGIIEHAVDTCKIKRVALAFSQFGVYREAVEAAGGLKGAYAKYLPNVEAIYPDLQLLAISAVDKTEVDAEGREIPAPDFTSTGLEDVMEWVLCSTNKDAVAAHDRKEYRGWDGLGRSSSNDAWSPVLVGKKKRRKHRKHRKHQNVQQNVSTENDRTSSSHLSEFHRTLLDLTLLDLKNDWRYLKSEGVWKALLGCVFFMGPTLGFWGVYGVAVRCAFVYPWEAPVWLVVCVAIFSVGYLGLFFWANHLYHYLLDRDNRIRSFFQSICIVVPLALALFAMGPSESFGVWLGCGSFFCGGLYWFLYEKGFLD